MYMNEFDVTSAVITMDTYREGTGWDEAARKLASLVDWTNDNSDGWPYWSKPSTASKKLQHAILSELDSIRRGFTNPDLDPEELGKLLRPVKAFLTRNGADWREVL
jgi:hypothetical protein